MIPRRFAVHVYDSTGVHLMRVCRAVDEYEHARAFAADESIRHKTTIIVGQHGNGSTVYNIFINGKEIDYTQTITRKFEKIEAVPKQNEI